MTRFEFEVLRDVPDKLIAQDVLFAQRKSSSPLYLFENVAVENSMGVDVRLSGHCNPLLGKIVFNFYVPGVGPICRLCVNGRCHPNVGRTHKHDLKDEGDPLRNLPHVLERQDLVGKNYEEIWHILCRQASIKHRGRLITP